MAPIAVQNGKNDHAKTKSSEGSEPAIEVVATLVPWADKEERVRMRVSTQLIFFYSQKPTC